MCSVCPAVYLSVTAGAKCMVGILCYVVKGLLFRHQTHYEYGKKVKESSLNQSIVQVDHFRLIFKKYCCPCLSFI